MRLGKKTAVAAGALALVGAVAVAGRGEPEVAAAAGAAEVAAAELRSLEVRVEAAGTVEPIRIVEVKSKASGEVLRLFVETGAAVEQGALLAEVDPRDVQNHLDQAEADLEVARVQAQTAEAQRQRTEELRKSSVVTQQEYEQAVQGAANAQAQLVRARTNLQLARERRGDVTIRAPIAGTVIQRTVEQGQIIASATSNVSGGTTLFTMADLSEMQVRTLVDETDIGRVRPGLPAQVTVEAYPDRTFRGEVLKIEPQAVVEQNVTMFPVLVRLENREGLLKPGMNAEVVVEVARRTDALAVPNAAVVGVRDAAGAARVLGLDEEALRAALRGPGAPGGPGAPAGAPEECRELFAKARSGGGFGSLSDAERARMRECREQMRASRGEGRGGAAADGTRPGVVFVQGAAGIEPRRVRLGVSDWEYTEVLDGLQPGERVMLVSVARMQAQQQEMTDRIRERASGPIPSGGRGRR